MFPGPNDAQVSTRVNRSSRGQIWNRVVVFQVRPDGDHRNQVQECPLWEPENDKMGLMDMCRALHLRVEDYLLFSSILGT